MIQKYLPVTKGLKYELMRYGEYVPRECYLNPRTGNLWQKHTDGRYTKITKNPRNVLRALDNYLEDVSKKRDRCMRSRKEWFGEKID